MRVGFFNSKKFFQKINLKLKQGDVKMKTRTIGIEREWFITKDGKVSPLIDILLPELKLECKKRSISEDRFGFELFAGQVEDRTPPAHSKELVFAYLKENEILLRKTGGKLDLDFLCVEYLERKDLGELLVNSFDCRHASIWKEIDEDRKVAASQVAAIHVHFKISPEEAVKVLNYCRKEIIDSLCIVGGPSNMTRISAYRNMAGTYGDPNIFQDSEHLLSFIEEKGGEKNVWDLVRYKISTGTIEFRMFGATDNYDKIADYISSSEEIIYRSLNS